MHRIFTYGIIDKLIVLYRDNKLEDNINFDPGYARCIVEGRQLGYNTFYIEHPPMLSTCTTYEYGDSGNSIDKTMPY